MSRLHADTDGDRRRSTSSAEALGARTAALEHADGVIAYACYLAGARNLINKIRSDVCGPKIRTAIARHDTPTLFDWLIDAVSYQGISDRVAYDYLEQHGGITWRDIEQSLSPANSRPRLAARTRTISRRGEKVSSRRVEVVVARGKFRGIV
jgi:hypothetical protein